MTASRWSASDVAAADPIQALVAASETVNLTIAGTSRAWGIERHTLVTIYRRTELAIQCRSSLLITRRYSQVRSHMMSVKSPIIKEPHPQPLPASGEGRQSTALAGWGSDGIQVNLPDMISPRLFTCE